ncbi:MAG: hypothetical protein Q8K94_02845 [Moraxellaceae bacterium]|nr:hypothetical protein [Moraxellaceae bacterium]
MFLLKKCIISMNKSLIMCLSFIVLGLGNVGMLAAASGTSSNIQAIETAVAAFKTIGTLRKEFPINADAIAGAYAGALQALVQEADASAGLSLDSNVLAAIDEIKNENEPLLAAQVIDKSLQHVFFQTVLDRITSVRDNFDSSTTVALGQKWDEATAAFQAIKSTAARENKIISADKQSIVTGSNPALDIQITEALARGKTALNKTNSTEDKITVSIERQVIRIALARAYYIGVLREVAGILSNKDDLEGAREAQKEGEIFYRIIESFITKDNPLGNLLIKAQLMGNVANVGADHIVSELNKGFIGRVKAELKANESSVGTDRGRAMEVAEEALLYANIFLPDLEIRLSAPLRSNMESALNDLKSASNAGDVTKATGARKTVSDILASYESELELAKYSKTHDTAIIIDGAVTAFQAIGVLRKQFPINAEAIAAEYDGDLQQLTKIVDQLYGLSIDQDILAAIEFIKNENQVLLAAQAIDKSLQRVFALAVYNRLTLVSDHFDDLTTDELALEWDRAYAAYQAIAGTAARENKVLTADKQTIKTGSNPDIDDQITLAFVQGRQALSKGSADDGLNVAIARENIVIPLARSFLIGVLREIEGIISDRDADVDEAREKQIEGEFFYRIVEGFISQDNPSGNSRIKAQLTGDMANVVANEVVSEISRGIIGQVNRIRDQLESAFGDDKNQAVLAAERLSLYVGIFLPDLELRLGSLQRVRMENALQDVKESSETGDESKALAAQAAIIEIISAYENELI